MMPRHLRLGEHRRADHVAVVALEDPVVVYGKRGATPGLMAFNDRLFFGHRQELWVSDGTPEGTLRLKSISTPRGFTVFDDRLSFSAYGGTNHRMLWVRLR